jgi:hypothetical protein
MFGNPESAREGDQHRRPDQCHGARDGSAGRVPPAGGHHCFSDAAHTQGDGQQREQQ